MKFTLTRSAALHILRQALKTCNTKAKGQPDSEFLFQVKEGALALTSLNETAEQLLTLPCEGLEYDDKESFSVAGQAVVEFLNQFPEEEVQCVYKHDDGIFVMGNKKTRFVFPTGVAEDFVPFNYVPQGKRIEVSASLLREGFKSTAFAASTDYATAPMTAVRVKIADSAFSAQATDTLRISIYSADVTDLGGDSVDFLLPHETAEILCSMLDNVDKITIQPGARHIRFEWQNTVFTSTLENTIGKPFPELSRWMRGKENGSVKISRENLARALKLAGLVARDSYVEIGIKPLEEDGTGGGLLLATNAKERGASQDVLIVQEQSGEGATFVAHKFLVKAVENAVEPWITLSFREQKEGLVCLVIVDHKFEHLIFPVVPSEDAAGEADGAQDE